MRSSRPDMKFFEDLVKMAGGAMGSLTEIRQHIRKWVKEGVDQIIGEMDMVTRAEFERVEAMAQKARERQIDLEKRLAALEKKPAVKTATPAKKASVKKGTKKK